MKMKIYCIIICTIFYLHCLSIECLADYTYIVKKGDTLSEITLMFSGSHEYQRIAKLNNISNPDLIFPGDKVTLSQKRPNRALREYLGSIYFKNYKYAYSLLSSETNSWYSYNDFIKSFEITTYYDLSSIIICSDFQFNGKHFLQMEINHYEDPAKWGFILIRQKYNWYLLLFDKNPTHPMSNGYLEWKCKEII
ncbi:MAG: LysM peptidoglycan-binding domain-containing protein [Deltaproteobacteria bacterium]|nr:LysM peptidoglycan-binding domain-containing protein [Deltaproteobacteria bacterium]